MLYSLISGLTWLYFQENYQCGIGQNNNKAPEAKKDSQFDYVSVIENRFQLAEPEEHCPAACRQTK